jgi:hypothetical protein
MNRATVLSAFLAATISLGVLPNSAAAQNPPRIGPDQAAVLMNFADLRMQDSAPFIYRGDSEQERGAWVARGFARCAVKHSHERARELLDSSIAGRAHPVGYEQRYFRRFRTCTPTSGMADVGLIRGAIAENVVLSNAPPAGFRAAASVPELIDYLRYVEALEASADNIVTVTQLGYQCRAALSPAATYAALDKEPGSAEEQNALRELDRRTPLCDVFFDRGEEVSHWFRRAFVARGLYYWQRFLEA